jgi:hypothetical protein
MGRTLGAVVGGAAGTERRAWASSSVATILMPAIGPVLAIGAVGAAMFTAGVVGGAVAEARGELGEGFLATALLYEDALMRGRTVAIVLAEDEAQADAARDAMRRPARGDDAARERWWIGLRDAEHAE